MSAPDRDSQQMLDALRKVVAETLERKRRLGHYAVVWRGDRPVCIGPDAPSDCDQPRSEPDRSPDDVAESGDQSLIQRKAVNISFSVNDDILLSLKENAEEFTQDVRFLSALMWYRKDRLSLGKAAELAGYNKLDFIERMKLENEAIFDYRDDKMGEILADVAKLP
ncbi:UPF0175 family protein [Candidatus Thiodictyon syntrophicum]|jgi:predicted HTH domain antitoxin|uniref:UPF0175 family protein n=1 Tax=Candidatus Thiodictyon syntrophicum TaxID=1166950 RepID=UPI001F368895|nr:UPF0175 family protein [Candidatus Thiodictyon syntrophicum]